MAHLDKLGPTALPVAKPGPMAHRPFCLDTLSLRRSTWRQANDARGKPRANGCHCILWWADGAPRRARANSALPSGPMAHLAKPGSVAVTFFFFCGLMARLDKHKLGPQRSTFCRANRQSQGQWLAHLPFFLWADGAPRQARANSAPPFEGQWRT